MIESPILQELKDEWTREAKQKALFDVLSARFGDAAEAVEAELKAIDDERLDEFIKRAAKCRSLAAFRKQLSG